jgi:hypothetical protein
MRVEVGMGTRAVFAVGGDDGIDCDNLRLDGSVFSGNCIHISS